MNTPKPATPLPWIDGGSLQIFPTPRDETSRIADCFHPDDVAYIVEACNAYPQLVADRERLIAALHHSITDPGAVGMRDAGLFATKRLNAISEGARAALAKGAA